MQYAMHNSHHALRFTFHVLGLGVTAMLWLFVNNGFSDTNYDKVWENFVILVWQYKMPSPGLIAERAYKSVNLEGIHLDNGFSAE